MKKILYKIYHSLPLSEKTRTRIHNRVCKDKNKKSSISKENFLKKISKYDVISFDIFDTLITRLIYQPDDLFIIIGNKIKDNDFLEKRKNAENKARVELKKDVNLDEIYDYYEKIYNVKANKLKKLEEELEISISIPRKDMLFVFNELKKKNKTIILTSDMYLKKDTILKMLKKCGYDDFNDFYLSNDLNKRKDTKEIWPFLKEKYSGKKIVHIGDNLTSDYNNPKEYKIDAFKISNPREQFSNIEMSNYVEEFINNSNIGDSILLGNFVNKILFNSPFSDGEISDINDFGYIFYGPIIDRFLKFICDNCKEDTLLFLAREGYNLQKIYKYYVKINKIPETKNIYFLSSRKATITANIKEKEDINNLLDNNYVGSLKDYFKQLIDYDYNGEDFEIELPKQKKEVYEIVEKYSKEIIKKCKIEKENYLSYIKKTVGKVNYDNVSIIDLGYSGTIQYQLSKLTNKNLKGYYLTNSKNVKRYFKDSKLNFLFDINNSHEFEKIYSYSLILEFFLSAPHGQLIRFDKVKNNIEPVYNDEIMDDNKKEIIKILYKSVTDYLDYSADLSFDCEPSLELICRLYTCVVEGNIISKTIKNKFDFTDSFCSNETKNVFRIISRY